MKTTFEITADLIENNHQFDDAFFNRFELRHNTSPLQLNEQVSKNYYFPTFYNDVTCAIAIFFCDYQRALDLMPHPSMKPIKSTLGRAVVIFSCYEYKQVLNIKGYNEIAMTIPVMVDTNYTLPLLPMVMKIFKNTGYYVFSMPVTSYENQIRGEKIWGLPKITEEIEINTDKEFCKTKVKDENGENYFELTVPINGKLKKVDESGFLYSVKNNKLLKSQTNFKGDFQMNTYYSYLWNKSLKGENRWLKLGNSPRANILKELQIEETPFQFRFCPNMKSCFDLPLNH